MLLSVIFEAMKETIKFEESGQIMEELMLLDPDWPNKE